VRQRTLGFAKSEFEITVTISNQKKDGLLGKHSGDLRRRENHVKSHVVIRDRKSGTKIPALSHVSVQESSDSLGWKGFRLEVGNNLGCDMDDVTVEGHYLLMNLGAATLNFETRCESTWVSGCQPTHAFWIIPEGHPFSIRHSEKNFWASALIDGEFLDAIAGCHHELKTATGVADDVLAHLMLSLMANLHNREENSNEVDKALINAFVITVAQKHGKPAAELPSKGGIAPHQLKTLKKWLEDHIETSLTIDDIASQTGLSVAHFSREFKRSTGITPWGYVVQLRLDRASQLLKQGQSIGMVAANCGFSDHSHLSRLFKQRFGISPLAFARKCDDQNHPVEHPAEK
jgi:AraC family transcriptional regulator